MTGPDIVDLQTHWSYRLSPIAARTRIKRLRHWMTGRRPAPHWRTVRPVTQAARWNVLFLYAPSGDLDHDQHCILDRVRGLAGSLLIVLATPHDHHPAVLDHADALMVKDLPGFDFFAYRIALDAIATGSAGATAYIQNDSVLGPFGDIDGFVQRAPWDLTGFIGARTVENHISSFAFILRDVTPARMTALRPVLSPAWRCDDFNAVILLQETRLARIASRSMSVGAYWYVPTQPMRESAIVRAMKHATGTARHRIDVTGDATLACPVGLLDAGFPFLKRSLFTKFAGLHDEAVLRQALLARGWKDDTPEHRPG